MNNSYIDTSAKVSETILGKGAKIYKECSVRESTLGEYATVGDYSRIIKSELSDHVALQRYQLVLSSKFGRYTYTGKNFTAWHCEVGAFCSISWNVSIGGANHDYHRITTHSFLYTDDFGLKPSGNIGYDRFADYCIVGNDVWIAAGASILRNVTVGDGAVIAAGAVVTEDVKPYDIVAGVPARPIKRRFSDSVCDRLLEIKWWEFPSEVIRENYDLFLETPSEKNLNALQKIKEQL